MLLCLLFRLFYLYQGTRMTWIKEETLFTLLYWLSPIFTCITITSQMCEGLYISLDSPSLIFYRDGQKKVGPSLCDNASRLFSGHEESSCKLGPTF